MKNEFLERQLSSLYLLQFWDPGTVNGGSLSHRHDLTLEWNRAIIYVISNTHAFPAIWHVKMPAGKQKEAFSKYFTVHSFPLRYGGVDGAFGRK